MRNFLSILVFMLCQCCFTYAQECLVCFGVNEEVTENPIDDANLTLYFNDSIQVPYTVSYPSSGYKRGKKLGSLNNYL